MHVKRRQLTKEQNGLCKTHIESSETTETKRLTLWNSPATTLYYFFMECLYRFAQLRFTIIRYKELFSFILFIITSFVILSNTSGPHLKAVQRIKELAMWWSWWIWLGFLSSCGFGTGLHTFVLYLGPFIAEVTMGAYECGTLKFPRPPYPDRIICPENVLPGEKISFWRIMRKVQFESIFWGLGTAIGELPPYFMARGARLSGRDTEHELKELKEIIARGDADGSAVATDTSIQKKIEVLLHELIVRAGFIGILLCASVPNPLFDLAGMTCGHFLVPFWSFFGATLIGKALIKVHLQQFTVIALSSEHHVESLVDFMGRIPVYGPRLQAPFLEYLQQQKANLHNKVTNGQQSWLQSVIFLVVTGLICSFVISIINALANNYHHRLQTWRRMASEPIECDD